MNRIDLSIIIPVINEARALPLLLADIAAQMGLDIQVIVADGGSVDASRQHAQAARAVVVESSAGRALQMNTGAARAEAPLLLFLHADSRLPRPCLLADALAAFRARGDEGAAGHFPLRFERTSAANSLQFRYMEAKSALSRPYTTNGDQGLLLAASRFVEIGGFDERLHFLEDQRIVERLRRDGAVFTLPGRLETSARRFEAEGPAARYHLMAIIMAMHVCGIDEFFDRAPGVYQQQAKSGRLLLTPYFRLLWQLMWEFGWRRSLRHWRAVGDFVLGESWQPFFLVDVLKQKQASSPDARWLRFHDRRIAPLLHNRVAGWITTGLIFALSMGPIAAWYRWRERALLR